MSNGSKVLIYLSFLLKEALFQLLLQLQTNIWLLCIFMYKNQVSHISFYFTILRTDISNSRTKPAGLDFQSIILPFQNFVIFRNILFCKQYSNVSSLEVFLHDATCKLKDCYLKRFFHELMSHVYCTHFVSVSKVHKVFFSL